MKTPVILVAATMLSSAFASDITLTDGRTFYDASVASQAPRTVIIKHTGGLTSVPKHQLPADLQARFPINEAAARAADEKAAFAQEAALKAHQTKAERAAQLRTEQEAGTPAKAAETNQAATDTNAQLSLQKLRAKTALEQYFLNTFSWNPGSERIVEVTITDIRQSAGWSDRWTVIGRAVMHNYQHSAQRVNTTGMNNRAASQAEYRAAKKTVETRNFEADYSPESSSPLNVTLR